MFSEVWDGVEHGANTERTQQYAQGQLCYPWACLSRSARSPIIGHMKHMSVHTLLASERSERDTPRGNTIENRIFLF